MTVAARLTGHLLIEVARLYRHNIHVLSLLMQTLTLDIVLVGFLEILYHIPSMTCKAIEVYEGEHLSHILAFEFKHITKKGGMCVMQVVLSQSPG
jgi:hypothetical protein